MNVSAIIVTRGDHPLDEILASLPAEWEVVIWENGKGVSTYPRGAERSWPIQHPPDSPLGTWHDLAVYGRYAAIEHASGDLIYVQDDDCVISDPQALVSEWERTAMFRRMPDWDPGPGNADPHGFVVANMPQQFRHDFYRDNCLVGFGAVFHRDLPARAFEHFWSTGDLIHGLPGDGALVDEGAMFHRACDVVFTALTPRVLVDVPYRNLPWAENDDRMYRQPGHADERRRMLELALKARDAT